MKYIREGTEKKSCRDVPTHLALVQLYCFALRHLAGTSLRRCPVPPSENYLPFMVHQNKKPCLSHGGESFVKLRSLSSLHCELTGRNIMEGNIPCIKMILSKLPYKLGRLAAFSIFELK